EINIPTVKTRYLRIEIKNLGFHGFPKYLELRQIKAYKYHTNYNKVLQKYMICREKAKSKHVNLTLAQFISNINADIDEYIKEFLNNTVFKIYDEYENHVNLLRDISCGGRAKVVDAGGKGASPYNNYLGGHNG